MRKGGTRLSALYPAIALSAMCALTSVASAAEPAQLMQADSVISQVSRSPAYVTASQLARVTGSISNIVDLDVVSDSDGLLNIPGQYTSKAQFFDSAANARGYVEVYATSVDRANRAAFLDASTETDYALGTVLVRLMSTNPPAGYQTAVANIVLP